MTGTIGEYWYDGDGRRIKKRGYTNNVLTEETIFLYDASGKLIGEYSNAVTSSQSAKIAYLTSDHLGSPRINTDLNGNVTSRHDYHPFGEEIVTSQRSSGLGYPGDTVRKQFTGYERDDESDLDFAQARMYNFLRGRFTTVDPLLDSAMTGNPQSWNRYSYTFSNPLNFIDPTGEMTDYVDDQTGKVTHIYDTKNQVIATTTAVINRMQELASQTDMSAYNSVLLALESNDVTNLHLTRHDFMSRASTTYGESSFWRMPAGDELADEMKAIAWVNTRNDIAYAATKDAAKDYNLTSWGNQTDKMKLANLAIVNQRRNGPDPSFGATNWDGREQGLFPDSEKRTSVRATEYGGTEKQGTWRVHKNTVGWKIQDDHYAKWKANVGRGFRAPQFSPSLNGRIGYVSTAVYGSTIFWKRQ